MRFFVLLLLAAQAGASAQEAFPVQMGYRVRPDTVLIGQPFNVFIKVLAPKGVRFEFPNAPDTATQNGVRPIELRGDKIVSMLGDTAVALYHLVAWDVGNQPLRLSDVKVVWEGQERSLPLGGAQVYVKSVLPADTSLHIPKPARPLIILAVFNWLLWLGLLAAALAVLLLWWVWRRYRNRPKPPLDAYVKAQQEFARVEARRLLEEDRGGEYLAAMVDVARDYLAGRIPGVRRSNTSFELLQTMEPRDGVERELPRWLHNADLVKFARGDVLREEARAGGAGLRAIVDHVEARLRPDSEPAKRLAAGQERAA